MCRLGNKYKDLLITLILQLRQFRVCQQTAHTTPSPHTATLHALTSRPEHTNSSVNLEVIKFTYVRILHNTILSIRLGHITLVLIVICKLFLHSDTSSTTQYSIISIFKY